MLLIFDFISSLYICPRSDTLSLGYNQKIGSKIVNYWCTCGTLWYVISIRRNHLTDNPWIYYQGHPASVTLKATQEGTLSDDKGRQGCNATQREFRWVKIICKTIKCFLISFSLFSLICSFEDIFWCNFFYSNSIGLGILDSWALYWEPEGCNSERSPRYRVSPPVPVLHLPGGLALGKTVQGVLGFGWPVCIQCLCGVSDFRHQGEFVM